MDAILNSYSWMDLLKWVFGSIVTYVILALICNWARHQHSRINTIARFLQMFYWPVVSIILIALFIGINPLIHGVFSGILILLFWPLLREYFLGVFVKFRNENKIGNPFQIGGKKGILTRLGSRSVTIESDYKVMNIPFSEFIFSEELLESSTQNINRLVLQINDKRAGKELVDKVMQLSFNCPFLALSSRPIIELLDQHTLRMTCVAKIGHVGNEIVHYFNNHFDAVSSQSNS
jgi:hypothetical protein